MEDAEGREVPLGGDPTASEPYKRGFLAYVWETVGRMALEQVLGTAEAKARNGATGALEEDARLTALFLWTLQATDVRGTEEATADEEDVTAVDDDEDDEKPKKKKAGLSLIYDVARRFSQPLGIHLEMWEGRIIEIEKGVVRLLPVAERAQQLFGDADAAAMSRRIEQDVKASRNYTFAFMQDVAAPPEIKTRGRGKGKARTSAGAAAGTCFAQNGYDARPSACRDVASGERTGKRSPRDVERGTATRPRLPAARQRSFRPIPEGQRREAAPGRDAVGGSEELISARDRVDVLKEPTKLIQNL